MEKLKVVSLFCGCGGTDVGLLGGFEFLGKKYKKNAVEIILANDIDESACNIFKENFKKVTCIQNDIKQLIQNKLIPDHDILTGGFPCQSFSIVAQNPPRLGYKSENGKLFFDMVQILKDKQPLAFIAENVKGILSANQGEAFPLILDTFKNAGYNVSHELLNSVWFGIPQKRERVFIIGIRKDLKVFPSFPKPIKSEGSFVPLKTVLFNENNIEQKYFFSQKAVEGLRKSNPKMNKGRVQDVEQPCATVGAHLSKISLNSTDPVLRINGKYRRFTPREVARIQSFPDKFILKGSDSQQYKSLGNAIPPVLMWHIFKSLMETLDAI